MNKKIANSPIFALLAFAAGIFCIQLDAFALNLALPQIGIDLSASEGGLKWVVSVYLLSVGGLMLAAGRLSDQYGYRNILIIGLALFGIASILCALAQSMSVLVIARAIQGAGGACIMPAGLALITNVYPKEKRSKAIGLAIGIGGSATAGGPILGGLVTEAVSWRLIFWLNIPIVLMAIYSAIFVKTEINDTYKTKLIDMRGLFLITLSLAILSLLIDGVSTGGNVNLNILLSMAFVILITMFFSSEKRSSNPLISLEIFKNRNFIVLTVVGAVINAITVVFLFIVPLSLQDVWHLSPYSAGVAFLPPALIMAFGGPIAGRLKTLHAVFVMNVCLGVVAAVFISVPKLSSFVMYLIGITICAIFLGIANALTLVATQSVVSPVVAGTASGITKTIITLAAGLGVVLTGKAADQAIGLSADHTIHSISTSIGWFCFCVFVFLYLYVYGRVYKY
ncbi:MFS transporter [Spartinivicinus sp. A2-2]|uniref:MFS transporter n=2 Tax=Spartinivicinus poritis TaxID=2994640 RepID=A0ABT5UJJ1_9GAMM|nr:MFS transporter [Spartinivicinus sp. A2-2]MDE1465209.1 MFS transporter [Spartinivicinus sp. A2-2]